MAVRPRVEVRVRVNWAGAGQVRAVAQPPRWGLNCMSHWVAAAVGGIWGR